MLCQYSMHDIPLIVPNKHMLTHTLTMETGMHIRQLIQQELLTLVWEEDSEGEGNQCDSKSTKERSGIQRFVRMLVVVPAATAFPMRDLCCMDTFWWGSKHAALANGIHQPIDPIGIQPQNTKAKWIQIQLFQSLENNDGDCSCKYYISGKTWKIIGGKLSLSGSQSLKNTRRSCQLTAADPGLL